MKELLSIKNYIYGKAIMSKLSEKPLSLIGIHKGKRFKIFFSQAKNSKSKNQKAQIVVEKNGQLFYPKHSREIINILK